jgi:hypothetical protein
MKSAQENLLPRHHTNNHCYPVLDSLYETIKSNPSLSQELNITLDFDDDENRITPISEIMCVLLSAYL